VYFIIPVFQMLRLPSHAAVGTMSLIFQL